MNLSSLHANHNDSEKAPIMWIKDANLPSARLPMITEYNILEHHVESSERSKIELNARNNQCSIEPVLPTSYRETMGKDLLRVLG